MRFDELSIAPNERALILGGTGAGKSELEHQMLRNALKKYPFSQHLVLDSKPRFKATWKLSGLKKRYPGMEYGEKIGGAVLVEEPEDIDTAYKRGFQIALAQISDDKDEKDEYGRLTWIAQKFYSGASGSRERFLWIDEGMDYYSENGMKIRGSSGSILRTARAGRERGMAMIFCSQRARGIPGQVLSEMTRLYLFRMDHSADVKYLETMGAPQIEPPEEDHLFWYWNKKTRRERPVLLTLKIPARSR
jgi:hypothetical protein